MHRRRPRAHAPVVRRLWPFLAILLSIVTLASPASATPVPQRPESATIAERSDWLRRDRTVQFDRNTARQAQAALQGLAPGDYGRAAALFALGASGSIRGRDTLVDETGLGGPTEERVAATLGLGELGAANLDGGTALLDRLTRDPSDRVAEAALVALLRSGAQGAAVRVADVAAGAGSVAGAARDILAYHRAPETTDVPRAWATLYGLRWDAARNFGLVDGKVWGRTLIAELVRDRQFLSGFVLRMLLDTPVDGFKDHLLEVLLEGQGVARIEVAADLMPAELELLIDSGVWRPASNVEWIWLVRHALEADLQPFFSRTFAQALDVDVERVRTMAAGVLHRPRSRFEEILVAGLTSENAGVRADAMQVVGAMGLTAHLGRLEKAMDDPDIWVAANAYGALIRLGHRAAAERIIDLLATPRAERPPFLVEYVFEVLARSAPDRNVMTFVRGVADRLAGFDRAAADGILLLNGELRDTKVIRSQLPLMNPTSPLADRSARALAVAPTEDDIRLLGQLFPRQQAPNLNMTLAVVLARSGERQPLELLEAAVWTLPWSESLLAAGIVHRVYGLDTLLDWAKEPPPYVTAEDLRRLGWAIGEFGGLRALERLRVALGTTTGSERPAIQGAVLGALSVRTR